MWSIYSAFLRKFLLTEFYLFLDVYYSFNLLVKGDLANG
jgi:hypothetical protein